MIDSARQLARAFWTNSLATAASRVLGLLRDVATAALLGLGHGGALDTLVVAFRLANLPRRILGEGALAASLLPVFTAEHQRDPRQAWQLVSVLLVAAAAVLSLVVLAGEAACWLYARSAAPGAAPLAGLTAIVLPYALLVCLAAQVSAVLQALLLFRLPAVAPALLNVCWLAAVWFLAPRLAGDPGAQARAIAVAIVASGALQLAVQWPVLRGAGFRFDFNWRAAAPAARQIGRSMLPIALAMAATQVNTLVDSLLAIGLAAEPGSRATIAWLGHAVAYPLETGAAAAVYYGERFYQLPVGLLGVALATSLYPLVARHAARGDAAGVGRDVSLALRLVWFAALPAGVGLVLVARPLVRLLFEHGAFTPDDTRRTAAMIACYGGAAWAYCALPVLTRGFYALGQRAAPARLGLASVGLNVALSLTLVWPWGERGLAVATAAAASVQAVLLAGAFSRSVSRLAWRELGTTIVRGAAATAAMVLAVVLVRQLAPGDDAPRAAQAVQLIVEIAAGSSVYLLAAWLLGMRELALLLGRESLRRDAFPGLPVAEH